MKTIQLTLTALLLSAAMASCSMGSQKDQAADSGDAAANTTNTLESAGPEEFGADDTLDFSAPLDRPVVVDFSASWCPPCRQMHPIYDALARKYAAQVRFIYVDVDACPQLAADYEIDAVPTLLFVTAAGDVTRNVGALDEADLEAAILSLISDGPVG